MKGEKKNSHPPKKEKQRINSKTCDSTIEDLKEGKGCTKYVCLTACFHDTCPFLPTTSTPGIHRKKQSQRLRSKTRDISVGCMQELDTHPARLKGFFFFLLSSVGPYKVLETHPRLSVQMEQCNIQWESTTSFSWSDHDRAGFHVAFPCLVL